jgi:hypothetical protein
MQLALVNLRKSIFCLNMDLYFNKIMQINNI